MNPGISEYTALRTELVHYDKLCLTILGSLLTISTAVYGIVADKGTFQLLPPLSIVWVVGFVYILDKRSSIVRIALYLRVYFESSDKDFGWESWLRDKSFCASKCCKGLRSKDLSKHVCLHALPLKDPIHVEYFLLVSTLVANVAWLWALGFSNSDLELKSYVLKDPSVLIRWMAAILTVLSLVGWKWTHSLLKRYHSFDQDKFVDDFCKHNNQGQIHNRRYP